MKMNESKNKTHRNVLKGRIIFSVCVCVWGGGGGGGGGECNFPEEKVSKIFFPLAEYT